MGTISWVREALTNQDAAFQVLHHPRAVTAQQLAELEHVSGHTVAKTIIVMADDRPVEVILPASRIIAMRQLKRVLGCTECRLATEAEIAKRFSDCELGAVPPLRRWPGVEVVMDESLKTGGDIVFPAGTQHDAVRMRFDDWVRLVRPRTAAFTRMIGAAERQGDEIETFEDWEY